MWHFSGNAHRIRSVYHVHFLMQVHVVFNEYNSHIKSLVVIYGFAFWHTGVVIHQKCQVAVGCVVTKNEIIYVVNVLGANKWSISISIISNISTFDIFFTIIKYNITDPFPYIVVLEMSFRAPSKNIRHYYITWSSANKIAFIFRTINLNYIGLHTIKI